MSCKEEYERNPALARVKAGEGVAIMHFLPLLIQFSLRGVASGGRGLAPNGFHVIRPAMNRSLIESPVLFASLRRLHAVSAFLP